MSIKNPVTSSEQRTFPFSEIRSASTSTESFVVIRRKLPDRALKVLALLRSCGKAGATDEEVSIYFGWAYHGVPSVTGRILHRQHQLIVAADFRRQNKSGHLARVWLLPEFAS